MNEDRNWNFFILSLIMQIDIDRAHCEVLLSTASNNEMKSLLRNHDRIICRMHFLLVGGWISWLFLVIAIEFHSFQWYLLIAAIVTMLHSILISVAILKLKFRLIYSACFTMIIPITIKFLLLYKAINQIREIGDIFNNLDDPYENDRMIELRISKLNLKNSSIIFIIIIVIDLLNFIFIIQIMFRLFLKENFLSIKTINFDWFRSKHQGRYSLNSSFALHLL